MGFAQDLVKFKDLILKRYRSKRKLYQLILIPLVCALLPLISPTKVAYCAYVILVMSFFWITECVPIAITSLLPVFLFPLFGIMKSKNVSPIYFHDNIMFIFASLIIGIGIETTGLHQKIALKVCMKIGHEPKWILLGIMSVTGFLSIWISNTATTSMILPIVVSIVKQLVRLDPIFSLEDSPSEGRIEMDAFPSSAQLKGEENNMDEGEKQIESAGHVMDMDEEVKDEEEHHEDKDYFKTKNAKNLVKCFCLSITYAATIGGTGSLIGTSSNIVFKGYFEETHPGDGLNFLTFMLYSLPISFILIFVAWIALCVIWLPKGKFFDFKKVFSKYEKGSSAEIEAPNLLEDLIRLKYEKLGPYTWEQISIGIWFIIVVILWLTRDLYFVDGWGSLFKKDYVTDTSSAVFILFLASSWPKENIFKGKEYRPLMTWDDICKLFPWNIIYLIGGSLAMAEGCEKSGLSEWFGEILENVIPTNKILSFLVITTFSVIGTEFISNISMVSIILPILDTLSNHHHISYYYVLLPQAIAVNFSYMLPAAAPSNAVVFSCGHLTLKDMLFTGFVLKLLAFMVLFLASNTWLELIFVAPPWNDGKNATTIFVNNMTTAMGILNSTFA